MTIVNAVVEGESDTGTIRALIKYCEHDVGSIRVKRGKTKLDKDVSKYNLAAQHNAWVILRDSDSHCPVEVVTMLKERLQGPQSRLCKIRVAHSMTESWLMGDRQGFASYFGIHVGSMPREPENLQHAKNTFLQLCLSSRKKDIKAEVARPDGRPGILFVDHLNEFATRHWDIDAAAQNVDSLARAITDLRTL